MDEQVVLGILAMLVSLAALAVPILLVVLWVKQAGLARRVRALEKRAPAGRAPVAAPPTPKRPEAPAPPATPPMVPPTAAPGAPPPAPAGAPRKKAAGLESVVGRHVLGWSAVVLLLFAAAFFIRYAFQNDWIGPVGQVVLLVLASVGLVVAGYRYVRRGWVVFSRLLVSAGIVLLYLSAYASFGFYHVVSRDIATVFLLLVVVEAALLALLWNAWPVALMGLLGGLLTPVLISSPQDRYVELFIFLLALNAGTLGLVLRRPWPALASVALLGTQALFWLWYARHFHPEKMWWAVGFQAALVAMYLLRDAASHLRREQPATWEDLARLPVNAFLGFSALYVMLKPDYEPWLGTLGVVFAIIHAETARLAFAARARDNRLVLVALAVAAGFVAIVIPVQADSDWVSLGWAAEAAALWYFGLRARQAALRVLGAGLMAVAVTRLVIFDTPWDGRPPFLFVLNEYALPALGVVALLLGSALVSLARFPRSLAAGERTAVVVASLVAIVLLWLVLSVEIYGWFAARRTLPDWDRTRAQWLGQVALSIFWALYAAGLLAIGFRRHRAALRWTGLVFFGLTVLKVFFVDMADLDDLYRVLAFLVVALLAGAGAWGYARARAHSEGSIET